MLNSMYSVAGAARKDVTKRAASFGRLACAMAESASHQNRSIDSLSAVLLPAMIQERYHTFYDSSGQLIGCVAWATLTPEVLARVRLSGTFKLHKSEWNEGDLLCITEFFCSKASALRGIFKELLQRFKHDYLEVHFLRRKNGFVTMRKMSLSNLWRHRSALVDRPAEMCGPNHKVRDALSKEEQLIVGFIYRSYEKCSNRSCLPVAALLRSFRETGLCGARVFFDLEGDVAGHLLFRTNAVKSDKNSVEIFINDVVLPGGHFKYAFREFKRTYLTVAGVVIFCRRRGIGVKAIAYKKNEPELPTGR